MEWFDKLFLWPFAFVLTTCFWESTSRWAVIWGWCSIYQRLYTIECRYNTVQYINISHTSLQALRQKINLGLNRQKTPLTSELMGCYTHRMMFLITIPKTEHRCQMKHITANIIDPSHKSHNTLQKYPIMHHFVTEMCTFLLQVSWCIVGYGTVHCGICTSLLVVLSCHKYTLCILGPLCLESVGYRWTPSTNGQQCKAFAMFWVLASVSFWTNNR